MQVKYRISDGEIICMGSMPNLIAGNGEAIAEYMGNTVVDNLSYFRFINGDFVKKSQSEIDALPANVATANKLADTTEFSTSPFHGITPTQADIWIRNNVTDLASAKLALSKIVRVLIYLVRRSDLG